MKTLLVAFDGSDNSLRALKLAVDLARSSGAKLTLAHAIQPVLSGVILGSPYPPIIDAGTVDEMDKAQRDAAQKMLDDVVVRLELGDLATECLVIEGPAPQVLDELAQKKEAWLVVVGSRGRNAAARVLLGSVSDRLVHICARPVLVVR